MKQFFNLFCYVLWLFPAAALASPAALKPFQLSAYSALTAKGGWLFGAEKELQTRCGFPVVITPFPDSGFLLHKIQTLQATRPSSQAELPELAVGIDSLLWRQAQTDFEPSALKTLGLAATPWAKPIAPSIAAFAGLIPYDFGLWAWIVDHHQIAKRQLSVPQKLADFLSPKLKKEILLQDPRASSPGLGFLLWTLQTQKDPQAFWTALAQNWLTLPESWSASYGLFLKEQAALVWSYTTSVSYHRIVEKDESQRFQVVELAEGYPLQIEGMAVPKGQLADPAAIARTQCIVGQLLSQAWQAKIPQTQWMYPARDQTPLPPLFAQLPDSKKIHLLTTPAAGQTPLTPTRAPSQALATSAVLEQWKNWVFSKK